MAIEAVARQPSLQFTAYHPAVLEIVSRLPGADDLDLNSIWKPFNLLGWVAAEIALPHRPLLPSYPTMVTERIKHVILLKQMKMQLQAKYGPQVLDGLDEVTMMMWMYDGQAAHLAYCPDTAVTDMMPPNPHTYKEYLTGKSIGI